MPAVYGGCRGTRNNFKGWLCRLVYFSACCFVEYLLLFLMSRVGEPVFFVMLYRALTFLCSTVLQFDRLTVIDVYVISANC